ncbi:MAG: histidine kinase [Reichenbachiella sp.]|uniref:sensor histidine kinase n=1 Tax=Reichenbachiella sp. TaxID=2184521 RepID=UPI003267DF13
MFAGLKKKPILISIPFWLLFTAIDLLKKTNLDFGGGFFLFYYLPGLMLWVLFTDPLYRLFRLFKKHQIGVRLVAIGVLGPLIGFTKAWMNVLLSAILGRLLTDQAFQFGFPKQFYVMEATIIAWILLIVFLFIDLYGDYQKRLLAITRLETDLKNAELNALKMQIQPHFLFNTHNAIATLLRTNKSSQALDMLMKLSDLLRVSLNSFEHQFVPLHQEIAFIKNYLDIEKVRFEDRLKIIVDLDEKMLAYEIPVFCFQPIIENGIKHGVSKNLGNSMIRISGHLEDNALIFTFYNTGEWQSEKPKTGGIGLENVRRRLENVYDGAASLELLEVEDGVEARLVIPILKDNSQSR